MQESAITCDTICKKLKKCVILLKMTNFGIFCHPVSLSIGPFAFSAFLYILGISLQYLPLALAAGIAHPYISG